MTQSAYAYVMQIATPFTEIWQLVRLEQPDPGDTIPDEPNDPVPDPEGEPE